MTRYRIEVDENDCRGSGTCAAMAPLHFEIQRIGIARPLVDVVDSDTDQDGADLVADAAECCPFAAIVLFDADTGQQLT